MTDQHRATPEQWDYVDVWGVIHDDPNASCLLELRARIEALEAAQQDKLDRLIALDAADPTPDPAMPELRAASAEARPDVGVKQSFVPPHALVDKWFDDARALSSTPLGVTRKVAEWAAQWGAAQLADPAPIAEAQPGGLVERLLAPEWVLQKDQTRKTTDGAQLIDGKWWAPCSDLFSMQRIVDNARSLIAYTSPPTAPAPAGGSVERVAVSIRPGAMDGKLNTAARAAIREVAAWLSEHTDDDASAYWAARLEQEAER
jgi:hypothetical protein